MRPMQRSLAILTLSIAVAGCAVGPDYERPDNSNFISQWFSKPGGHVSSDVVQADWWKVFNDPQLEYYIQEAALHNKDLQIALANVRRARALRTESRSPFFPQIAAEGQAFRSRDSDGDQSSAFDAGFDAAWELDIFGGTRRASEAADARVGSAVANYQDVMLTVFSEVARNYFEARGQQKRIAITEENAASFDKTADLIRARLEAGESSEFDYSRAQGQAQLTRARIPNLNAELYASIYTLSVLIGQPPEYLLDKMQETQPLPAPPDIVPVGLRSDILRRRPDVRQAERELAASVADIGVATSDLFPKFSLTGAASTGGSSFGDVFRASGGIWSFGSLIQWPIFQGGAIRARIEASEADAQAAVASYEKTVLQALAGAETALTRYGEELQTRRLLADAVQSRRKSVQLAQELFDAGEEDYFQVLDAERELSASTDDLVVSETQSITKLIALYNELGGGWELFSDPPAPGHVQMNAPEAEGPPAPASR